MVTMIIGGSGHVSGQWAEAIWGWILGTQLALVALVFGEQVTHSISHPVAVLGGLLRAVLPRAGQPGTRKTTRSSCDLRQCITWP